MAATSGDRSRTSAANRDRVTSAIRSATGLSPRLGFVIVASALLLSLIGAWLIMFRVTRPLKALEHAAAEVGRGRRPSPRSGRGRPRSVTASPSSRRMTAPSA